MKRLALAVALLIASIAATRAQSPVSVIGPITPGDCPQFSSNTVIKDGGFPCNGAPAVAFANPTGAVGLAAVNGAATTAMRSDAAPPLSATVQSALTATANQLLVGTGAFGFAAIGAPTRAGDIAYYNGTNWVMLAGNNSGTQVLSENASGVPAWSAAGTGTVTTAGAGLVLTGGGTTLGLVATRLTNPAGCAINATATVTCADGSTGANNGTYTTPAGALWLEIELVGGGGGGCGSGTAPGNGGAGTATTFGTGPLLTSGTNAACAGATGGTGGTPSGGFVNKTGASGQNGSGLNATAGGNGGISPYGSAGWGGAPGAGAGVAASSNSGSGGGGGGGVNATVNGGGGGGSGGFVRSIIGTPNATYTYVIGAGGAGGTTGTSGAAGGAGGSGYIQIIPHFD